MAACSSNRICPWREATRRMDCTTTGLGNKASGSWESGAESRFLPRHEVEPDAELVLQADGTAQRGHRLDPVGRHAYGQHAGHPDTVIVVEQLGIERLAVGDAVQR